MQAEKERAKQLVRFYVNPVEVTAEDGRKSFVDKIYVQVTFSTNHVAAGLAEEDHFKRFAPHWEAFKKSPEYQNYIASQDFEDARYTPLSSLSLTPATVETLKAAGVKSVEALIAADPDTVAHVRGIQTIMERAGKALSPVDVPAAVAEEAPKKRGPKKAA